jgi:arsenite oxidase large subunit
MELPLYERQDRVPLPPRDAQMKTTACAYCAVGCGYKVYTWPVGIEGGPGARDNAFGVDFPTGLEGHWVGPNQHTIVLVGGRPHHCVVVADHETKVVNPGGNHSIRGGTLALKCYTPTGPTRDRLQFPQVRVGGKLVRVSWETAIDVMAAVSRHVLAKYGEAAWGMKTYSYEFFENTYAITKLAFESIRTPAFAVHDKPSMASDTAGVDDAGIITFSAAYEDFQKADVLFVSGTDPYESKTVVFTEWMMRSPAKMIFVVPRRTMGVAYAESKGGLFLQIVPGTDALLHMALCRVILENGWEDADFLSRWVANSWEIDSGFGRGTRNTPWQWRTTWGDLGAADLAGYRKWLLAHEPAGLDFAARETGIPKEKIVQAAKMLSGGGAKERPKASFLFEKGNYWSNNYLNTASLASLALVCGSGNRPGRVVSRLGGHQRGWMAAAAYPREKSPERLPGRRKIELDLDRWVEKGEVRFLWVVGTTWTGAMAASQELARTVRRRTAESRHQPASARRDDLVEAYLARVDAGDMVLADSDLYPVAPLNTDLADIVLPAAGWGEHDGTRCNGERRLRLYAKFYDPPGEAKPDWWAVAQLARALGFTGYDWPDANAVFEEAARFSRGDVLDYYPLVWKARREGKKGHEALRSLGTTGIQCPVRYEGGALVGTARLHDSTLTLPAPEGPTTHAKWLTAFNTHSGKALLIKSPWDLFADFHARIKPDPKKGEFWLTCGRVNESWQSGFDDLRKPYLAARWPGNFVEIHPDDARDYKVESGDVVRLTNDRVLIQTGGFNRVEAEEIRFSWLEKEGHIRVGRGEIEAIAMVTPAVMRGLLFTYFLTPPNPFNALAHRVVDPITNNYRYKLATAKLARVGESPYKKDRRFLTFQRRDFAG